MIYKTLTLLHLGQTASNEDGLSYMWAVEDGTDASEGDSRSRGEQQPPPLQQHHQCYLTTATLVLTIRHCVRIWRYPADKSHHLDQAWELIGITTVIHIHPRFTFMSALMTILHNSFVDSEGSLIVWSKLVPIPSTFRAVLDPFKISLFLLGES